MTFIYDFKLDIIAHGAIGSPNRQYSVICKFISDNGNEIIGKAKSYYNTFKSRNEAFDFLQSVERGEIRMLKSDWN